MVGHEKIALTTAAIRAACLCKRVGTWNYRALTVTFTVLSSSSFPLRHCGQSFAPGSGFEPQVIIKLSIADDVIVQGANLWRRTEWCVAMLLSIQSDVCSELCWLWPITYFPAGTLEA